MGINKLAYIRWYDEMSGDGECSDLEGNHYNFNEWSFQKTVYKVTGISKKTGKKMTVKTRFYPGLFLDYKILRDKNLKKLKYLTPIFIKEIYKDNRPLWATKIELASKKHKKDILCFCFQNVLDSAIKEDLTENSKYNFMRWNDKNLDEWIDRMLQC